MPQNELVTLPRNQILHRMEDIEKLAEAVARSRMFGITTKEQALVLMAISQAEGRHPALAARDYNIIQGRPAKTAEAMMRDLIENGGKVEWHQLTDEVADATFSHPAGGTMRITWDQARVKRAGLSGREGHQKYPRQMLRSRCVSEGVRTVCPMATSGMYVPEEVRDMPAIDTTAPSSVSAAVDLDKFAEVSPPEPVTERGSVEEAFDLPPLPIRNETPKPRRSQLWQEKSYHIKVDTLLDDSPNWQKWADDFIYLIGEASSDELNKLWADNKNSLNLLRRNEHSDRYRDIMVAGASRRTDLHAEAQEGAAYEP